MNCQTCNGTKFVSVQKRVYITMTVYEKNGYPSWQCEGGTPVRHRLPTGRFRTVREICPACQGTGLELNPAHDPNCPKCHGRGTEAVSDGHGGVEYDVCPCVRVKLLEVAS